MRCPECFEIGKSKVIDSRNSIPNEIMMKRRRRECLNCGHRFTTYEILSENIEFIRAVARRSGEIYKALKKLKSDAKAMYDNLPKAQPGI